MRRLSQFGRWFRGFRIDHGFRSGTELSRRAGLNRAYLSDLERGKAQPKPDTIDKLARAMKLRRRELSELRRRAGLAKVPRDLRAELARPPFPNLVIWRNLPAALRQVGHTISGLVPPSPDRMAQDLLRAASSLLAWDALCGAPLDGHQRKRLNRLLESAYAQVEAAEESSVICSIFKPQATIASVVLPDLWRSIVFDTPRATRTRTSRLAHWGYFARIGGLTRATLSFRFKAKGMDRQWGVDAASADLIGSVHDAFILHALWDALHLHRQFHAQPDYQYHYYPIRWELNRLLTCKPDDLSARLRALGSDALTDQEIPRLVIEWEEHAILVKHAFFLARLQACSAIGEYFLGTDVTNTLKHAIAHARAVWEALSAGLAGAKRLP